MCWDAVEVRPVRPGLDSFGDDPGGNGGLADACHDADGVNGRHRLAIRVEVEPERRSRWFGLGRAVAVGRLEEADAIVVSCTNLPTYDVIAPLERELGKPIVTANQATMWSALRAIGKHAIGQGQALLNS